jgi:hypothetical protein
MPFLLTGSKQLMPLFTAAIALNILIEEEGSGVCWVRDCRRYLKIIAAFARIYFHSQKWLQ